MSKIGGGRHSLNSVSMPVLLPVVGIVAAITLSAAPPSAPEDLRAELQPDLAVELTWRDTSSNETGFELERRSVPGPWLFRGRFGRNDDRFTDHVSDGPEYCYRIRSINDDGASAWEGPACVTTPGGEGVPEAPSRVRVRRMNERQVRIRWRDNSTSEAGFDVERRIGDAEWIRVIRVGHDEADAVDTDAEGSIERCYRVRAFNSFGSSEPSDETCIGTPEPTGLLIADWTDEFDGSASGEDEVLGLAVSSSGRDIYAAGFTSTNDQGSDVWLRRYTRRGKVRWTRTYDGPASDWDSAEGVAVSSNGARVYVGGYARVVGRGREAWLARYNRRGRLRWSLTYGGGDAGGHDEITSIATDPRGRLVCAAGRSVVDGQYDAWIRCYSATGRLRWMKRFDGSATGWDSANGVAVAPDGNSVYLAGDTAPGSGYERDLWLQKYSSAGELLWERRYDNEEGDASANAVTVSEAGGTVYVAGRTVDGGQRDALLRAYSSRGRLLWSRVAGTNTGHDGARAISTLSSHGVVVAGYASGEDAADDIWASAYSPAGEVLWTLTHHTALERAHAVAAADEGRSIFVGGVIRGPGDGWVRRYRDESE